MFNFQLEKVNLNQNIGNGRFGSVYAYQTNKNDPTDDKWVVKIMATKKIQDFITLHLQEIALGFSFDHPNVMSVRGFQVDFNDEEEAWFTYLKLPRMAGSLKAKIGEQYFFSEEQIVKYFYGITCGLQYLHKKGVAHRDIKPDNILLDKYDQIKIGDIGIGMFIGDGTSGDLKERRGTPIYSAPEILDEKSPLKKKDLLKADIWSLGLVMAELCLLSIKMFDSPQFSQKTEAQIDQILKEIEKKRHSKVLQDLISSLLQFNPSKRKSLGEVQRILEQNYPFLLKRLDKEIQTNLKIDFEEAKIEEATLDKQEIDRGEAVLNEFQEKWKKDFKIDIEFQKSAKIVVAQ